MVLSVFDAQRRYRVVVDDVSKDLGTLPKVLEVGFPKELHMPTLESLLPDFIVDI